MIGADVTFEGIGKQEEKGRDRRMGFLNQRLPGCNKKRRDRSISIMLWTGARKSKNGTAKVEIFAYGVYALYARHHTIRKLKHLHPPAYHGFRVWPSSWLLMDFFSRRGIPRDSYVLDVGCGWGLGGIYCAKNHHANVTGVDIDPEVFPYLRLHAQINDVKIHTIVERLEELTINQLKAFNILIGADICFYDSMVEPLTDVIKRSLESGVQSVVIADPGRPPFKRLAEHFVKNRDVEIHSWAVNIPQDIYGQILKIG
ncbi:MAG: methyltransferase domain-containing protein [Thermodesulfobacteriota bacterium]|nr:methyltransferase domain-containing protein [Thermodesulfobacteriota bacterium]